MVMRCQAPAVARDPGLVSGSLPVCGTTHFCCNSGGEKDDKTANGRRQRSHGSKPATAGGDRIVGRGDDGSRYATL